MNKQPKKIFNKAKKHEVVAEIGEKTQKAKGMVFTNISRSHSPTN